MRMLDMRKICVHNSKKIDLIRRRGSKYSYKNKFSKREEDISVSRYPLIPSTIETCLARRRHSVSARWENCDDRLSFYA